MPFPEFVDENVIFRKVRRLMLQRSGMGVGAIRFLVQSLRLCLLMAAAMDTAPAEAVVATETGKEEASVAVVTTITPVEAALAPVNVASLAPLKSACGYRSEWPAAT